LVGESLYKLGKQLIKEGILLPKPTRYGLAISLNPQKAEYIYALIEKYFGKEHHVLK